MWFWGHLKFWSDKDSQESLNIIYPPFNPFNPFHPSTPLSTPLLLLDAPARFYTLDLLGGIDPNLEKIHQPWSAYKIHSTGDWIQYLSTWYNNSLTHVFVGNTNASILHTIIHSNYSNFSYLHLHLRIHSCYKMYEKVHICGSSIYNHLQHY